MTQTLTGMQSLLGRWWPSARLRHDPLRGRLEQSRYAPVSISNLKLTPWMRSRMLELRVYRPLSFDAGRRLTIVVPFRDREAHLTQLLAPLDEVLRAQSIAYRLLIVEQQGNALFNRGKLLNIGMHYARDRSDYYCLHDVDAVPVTANYACPSQPLRLVNRIVTESGDTHRTDYYFSGAVTILKEQAFAANGLSNEYCGWGKEDDDFFFRLLLAGNLCFYDTQGVYRDLPNPAHQQVQRKSPTTPPHVYKNRQRRSLLLRGLTDPASDGLSNLRYEVLDRVELTTHERILVTW